MFGEKTLDVIDQSPAFLSQVKGIGPKLIEKIRESWHEQKTVRSIMVFLHSYGIGTARAVRIYKTYGEQRDRDGEGQPVPPQHRHLGRRLHHGGRTGAQARHSARLAVPRPGRGAARPLGGEPATATSAIPEELLREHAGALTSIPPAGIDDAIEQLRITDEVVRDIGWKSASAATQRECANCRSRRWGGSTPISDAPGSPETA